MIVPFKTHYKHVLKVILFALSTLSAMKTYIYCHLRVFETLGFTPPFAWRASYFRANLSEDCYAPSRVLHY
jgi:hypothetical protein